MQLKKKRKSMNIKRGEVASALAMASCALLGMPAQAASDPNDWKIDTSLLYYSETDRVDATEAAIASERLFKNESKLDFKITFDTLTGASHNGGLVSDTSPQTFTTPSGRSLFSTAQGEVPLDDTFQETARVAISGNYSWLLNRTLRATTGLYFSNEYDFLSIGANGGLIWDLNQRNTTLSALVAVEQDSIDPEGGIPDPLSVQSAFSRIDSSDDRTVVDLLLGWTQVMNRRWIMQLNYNLSTSSGYHTDPFKIVTVVDDVTGLTLEAEALGAQDARAALETRQGLALSGTNAPGDAQIFENRPDSRTKHALYWENRYTLFNDDVVALGYRFMTDDWGIVSHSIDAKYRWQFGNGWFIQPHVRYYTQSKTDFWQASITQSQYSALLANDGDISADYRLGDLDTKTLGVKFGRNLANDKRWDARFELMDQSGDTEAADVDATIIQLSYRFFW